MPAGEPAGVADIDGVLTGSVSELTARSSCAVREFSKAVEEGDREFLGRLAGKLLIWRAMLLEPMKAAEGSTTARLMSGGKTIAAEFPPDTSAAGLMPGASVLIAAEAREVEDAWIVRVLAWGLCREIDGGEPMTRCKWPEPEEGPPEAPATEAEEP